MGNDVKQQLNWIESQIKILQYGDKLKGNPIIVRFSNGIQGVLEITKSDIKTIAFKNIPDYEFNEEKNILALDIPSFLESASYLGWAETVPGKHPEAAYFVYYSKKTKREFILCLRNMKSTGLFKPYAIISKERLAVDLEGREIHKEKPNQ